MTDKTMIKKVTKLFGVDNVKIFPIKEDTRKAYRCEKGIELSGARQVSLTYELEEKKLTNDCSVLDVANRVKAITCEIEYAKLTPFEVEKLQHQPFQLKAQILDAEDNGGDVHFCLYKVNAKVTSIKEDEMCITCLIQGNGEYTKHKFQGRNTKQSLLMGIEFHSSVKTLEAVEVEQ